jgi:hypothetical protein
MIDDLTVLECANWVRTTSRHDEYVKMGITSACSQRGFDSPADFARQDPEGFVAVVDALRDMTEQIPLEQTRSVGRGKPS